MARILYSHRVQSRDGQSVHIEELIRAFRDEGHEVLVVGPSFFDAASFGGESRTIAAIRRILPGAAQEGAELVYALPAARRLERAFKTFRPDIVYERYNLFHLAGSYLARAHGARLFLEVNSPLAEERARHGALRFRAAAQRIERWTWRSAECLLPVTGVLAGMIAEAGVDPSRLHVMPNGVDLARFAPRDRAAPNTVELGFVGFMRPWHGLDTVIDGMAASGDARLRLTLIGTGPALPDLVARAAAHGIETRVCCPGVLPPERIPDAVRRFDIALQPQATAYASPLKIFDYMAAGTAIVAPDQPNIREILAHEQNALLFDPTRPGAMWEQVARLIGDTALRQTLGTAARRDLETRDYTWRGNARRIAALASRVAG